MLTRTAKNPAATISLAEIRAQCRLEGLGTEEDALLVGYIRAAEAWIEEHLGIALLTGTWEYRLDCFPSGYAPAITIPIGPLSAIDGVVYVDTSGVVQTLPSTDYILVGSKLWPAFGLSWPATRQPSDIAITFLAGLGPDHNFVPEPIRQAVMMLAAYYYEQREAVLLGSEGSISGAPFGVRQLLQPYRAWSF